MDRADPNDEAFDRSIADAIERERRRQAAELREHLSEARRLCAWLRVDLRPDVAARLEVDLAAVQERVTDLLLSWQDLGGVVALATDAPALVALPRLQEEAEESMNDGAPPVVEPPPVVDEPPPVVEVPPVVDEPPPVVDTSPVSETPRPAEPSPSPAPPSPLASADQLAALQEHFTAGPSPAEIAKEGWHTKLDRVLAVLVPASDLDVEEKRVCAAVERCQAWTDFPKSVQRLLVGLVASRLRSLQDENGRVGGVINRAFSTLTAYSAREQPGFVFGLARNHHPQHGSWSEDADRYWEELADLLPTDDSDEPSVGALLRDVEELVPEINDAPPQMRPTLRRQAVRCIRAALEGGVRPRNTRLINLSAPLLGDLDGREFRTLRRAIRERAADEVQDDESDSGPIPDDWAWWACTRGRRAMLVGGDPREPNRQRLEQVFQFESLEWLATTGKPQSLQSAANRIRRCSVDLLIILTRFVGHNYDDILLPACKSADVDWVAVDHGYGSARIRQAIERFLDAEAGAD